MTGTPSRAELIAPKGVYAAVMTPFTEELEPDLPRFAAHCRWLLESGCDGLSMLGTTGEANALSVEQRVEVMTAAVEAGLPAPRMIPGTGACALADAVRLTRAAVALGCGGVLVLPPFYYKNVSDDGLYAFFAEIVERLGDDRLRLYFYHFPQMSAVPVALPLIERLLAAYPGVIAGLKDSSGDWAYSARLLEAIPGFGVYSGSEQYLLDNLRAGGAGCISATTNITAPLAARVMQAADPKQADEAQRVVTQARLAFGDFPLVAAVKAVKARLTGDAAWRTPLPPLLPLSDTDVDGLFESLRAIDGFDAALGGEAA